jgi:hypothetical protein
MEEVKIRGEYWIQDGDVDYADGSIGDRNHEGIAIDHICHQYADEVQSMAQDLEIEADFDHYDEIDTEALSRVLGEIEDKLEEQGMDRKQVNAHIMQTIGCDRDAYQIMQGGGYASFYAMTKYGWIAIRSNNIELFGYDESKRKHLYNGLGNVLDHEGIGENVPPEEIGFSLYDHKTKRSSYVTLADIENPTPILRTNQQPQTTYNKWVGINKDSEENKGQNPGKSVQNKWSASAKKSGIIGAGQDLWRGTSEVVVPFSRWLKLRESR